MKDDPEFNINFVGLVESHQCLYDHRQTDFLNRAIQDQAWESISREVKGTVPECKERYKNLRACYTRYLKNKLPSGSGAKFKRPYYLSEYMKFLEPFTKTRKQTVNISPISTVEQSELAENINENDDDDNDLPKDVPDTDEEELSEVVEDNQPLKTCTIKPILIKKRQSVQLDEVNKDAFDFYISKRKKMVPEEDIDLCFLKSLLPDMRKMYEDQKRRYKIQMISIAGSILSEPKISSGPKTSSSQQQSNLFSSSAISSNIPTIVGIPNRPQSHLNEASEDIVYSQQWY
ncbi:uncharacterized protein LOC126841445 [Adelges cooleyi]|uniref:uncharacterized protein LOC126841445 n=1 Tax=Adelges cooleyi TaxID=133065 RepID=UPI00217F7A6D|nr:uncharacterized protein LOC126841445 [Adelges cooleyi]